MCIRDRWSPMRLGSPRGGRCNPSCRGHPLRAGGRMGSATTYLRDVDETVWTGLRCMDGVATLVGSS
eukprot:1141020-Prorocentrum_lima.AAC.1